MLPLLTSASSGHQKVQGVRWGWNREEDDVPRGQDVEDAQTGKHSTAQRGVQEVGIS